MARPKRPADFAQRAKLIVDILTGQAPPDPPLQPESARAKVGQATLPDVQGAAR